LLGKGDSDRKRWIEDRRPELAPVFAIAVNGFTARDNHLHVLVRLDPDRAGGPRQRAARISRTFSWPTSSID
jgi:hypothetical protein